MNTVILLRNQTGNASLCRARNVGAIIQRKKESEAILKQFYTVFHKYLNIQTQNLLVKSQTTLERTNKEQGCLSLNYLSKEPISTICLKTILHHHQQRKNNRKLKISWVGMYTIKRVHWFVWLVFVSRFRNFIIEVLNTCYHSYSYGFKGRSNAISTFSLSVKIENCIIFKKVYFFIDATLLVCEVNKKKIY